ncbi:class I SAM-dependent methyltransferase [Panacibacter ginsenosidivorans]|uniref:Class I SAM-dependent methyltransferase n=1 Tax=Panacibacter ginsenosidivorans TaxID=1813871 RepID=A0A5B8V6H4_9BACT|nr:class I SAM-dependent methyltransferase [Panacibacter ginsenosidivorans]QEC66341.1 class I SAM-dependent methyltransferase [Panacibacter ginsenosidivorans]
MPTGALNNILNTDIYLIDQILKGRYNGGGKLLDAGCGGGRNLSWFIVQPNFDVYAIDAEQDAINRLLQLYPSLKKDHVSCATVQSLPFTNAFFDHIICSTVLHFANSKEDFLQMFSELIRVLKPGGSLFTRTASDIGIENRILPLGNGRFSLPDGTDRFLLTRTLIEELLNTFPITLAEPVKTTNVRDIRCMTTLVLIKS